MLLMSQYTALMQIVAAEAEPRVGFHQIALWIMQKPNHYTIILFQHIAGVIWHQRLKKI